MAGLRDSWRTSLLAAQQPWNPQPESIARTPYQLAPGWSCDAVIRLAASLDQASSHVIAEALVAETHRRGLALSVPSAVVETPGEGLEGVVEGHGVIVGGLRFVAERAESDGLGSSD